MNNLIQLLNRLKALGFEIVKRIEESAPFERLVSEYEGLELRQQKWIQASFVLTLVTALVLAFLVPLLSVVSTKSDITRERRLVNEMRAFQEQSSVIRKPAPRPSGFQALPASSATEFEESLRTFLASIDLGGDLSDLNASGSDVYKLSIPELSIRQALAITFQIDGWFPGIRNERIEIKVHPEQKEFVTLEATLRFVGGATFAPPPMPDAAQPSDPTGKASSGSGNYKAGAPTGPGGRSAFPSGPSFPNPPSRPGAGEDFGGELPPPTLEDEM